MCLVPDRTSDYILQVFHSTASTFCTVNLKPLLPGHVLVCPLRSTQYLTDLSSSEISDLFLTVQRVSGTLKRIYSTTSVNIGISDGELAGQSVPHVHVHVIPRREKDVHEDELYRMIENHDGETERLRHREVQEIDASGPREARSQEEMEREAAWLRMEMDKDVNGGTQSRPQM